MRLNAFSVWDSPLAAGRCRLLAEMPRSDRAGSSHQNSDEGDGGPEPQRVGGDAGEQAACDMESPSFGLGRCRREPGCDAGTLRSAGEQTGPGVRALLGHWLFGYIHPYPDGNGRMARFVMNAMLAADGYPWTVIRVDDRDSYLSALDRASIDMDVVPFTVFVAERVRWSMERGAAVQRR